MRLGKLAIFASIAVVLATPAFGATRTHRASVAHKVAASTRKTSVSSHKTSLSSRGLSTSSRKSKKSAPKPKFQSQRGIDDQRATEIQAALIRAGYLSGTPSGHWDSSSQTAMQKVQADNGWQTKLVPDSRALIKLGLGPGSSSPAPVVSSGESASVGSSTQGQQ